MRTRTYLCVSHADFCLGNGIGCLVRLVGWCTLVMHRPGARSILPAYRQAETVLSGLELHVGILMLRRENVDTKANPRTLAPRNTIDPGYCPGRIVFGTIHQRSVSIEECGRRGVSKYRKYERRCIEVPLIRSKGLRACDSRILELNIRPSHCRGHFIESVWMNPVLSTIAVTTRLIASGIFAPPKRHILHSPFGDEMDSRKDEEVER